MATTPLLGLPYATLADGANIELGAKALATKIESDLIHVGDLKATARATAPTGWLLCDGAAVSRTTYAHLFSAIGTAYGAGNGSTTFNVPDLRGRVPVGVDGAAGRLASNDALGNSSGAELVTLTGAQSGVNGNGVTTNNTSSIDHQHAPPPGYTGYLLTSVGNDPYANAADNGSSNPSTNTGGADRSLDHVHNLTSRAADTAHTNMPPYQVVQWLVKY